MKNKIITFLYFFVLPVLERRAQVSSASAKVEKIKKMEHKKIHRIFKTVDMVDKIAINGG